MPARRFHLLLLVPLVALAGCNSKPTYTEQMHLSILARVYGFYSREHRQSPPSMDDLKGYVKAMSAETRSSAGLDQSDLETLFVSPRDGQEYVLRTTGMMPQDVVLYEKVGKNGKRLVATASTSVREVDEEEFKRLVPDAK